jgi:DNA-binding transcriptional regulator YiaG
MPNLASVLGEQIKRMSRRALSGETRTIRRLTAQHRRDIAALKRQVAALQKTVTYLERQEKRRVAQQPAAAPASNGDGLRFRVDGLKSHRARLGLSAGDFGKLLGVSGQAVYNWENGTSKPRRSQVAKLASIRALGKREAHKRLEMLNR